MKVFATGAGVVMIFSAFVAISWAIVNNDFQPIMLIIAMIWAVLGFIINRWGARRI